MHMRTHRSRVIYSYASLAIRCSGAGVHGRSVRAVGGLREQECGLGRLSRYVEVEVGGLGRFSKR